MNVFSFLFLTVIAVLCAGLIRTFINARSHGHGADEASEETLLKIDRLEERIAVLERIVTENRVDLKQQIDGL